MSRSEDIRRYADVAQVMVKAAMGQTVRLTFDTVGAAKHYRQRCYKLRVLSRLQSTERLNAWDEGYGRSPYEDVKILQEENVVIIRRGPSVQIEVFDAGGNPVEGEGQGGAALALPPEPTIEDDEPLIAPGGKLSFD